MAHDMNADAVSPRYDDEVESTSSMSTSSSSSSASSDEASLVEPSVAKRKPDLTLRVMKVERVHCVPAYVAWERAGLAGKARLVPKTPNPFRQRVSTRAFVGRIHKLHEWLRDFAAVHADLVNDPETMRISVRRLDMWSRKWMKHGRTCHGKERMPVS